MKPVVENLEIKRNNFSKWIFIALFVLCLFTLFISFNDQGNNKWICLAGMILFGVACWTTLRSKIMTYQEGFTIFNGLKSKDILWKDITSLSYETSYHIHGVQPILAILHGYPPKRTELQVKQFNKEMMQRFFEMLDEQCPLASKNDHFIKLAKGTMTWKDKLKMY